MSATPHAQISLESLGWDDARERAFVELGDDTMIRGRVARVDRGACDVLTAAGPLRCTFGSAALTTLPCTGDWVAARHWPDDRVTVDAIMERRTLLHRVVVTPGQSVAQPLAANVDVVLVVEGAVPDPDLGRIERLLAVAWESGATPVVLLTKADLAGPSADVLVSDAAAVAAGVPVHAVSGVTGDGIEAVRDVVDRGTSVVLLGASGVGKSTLVNALAGATVMPTRQLRADGKGRHTTVTRELVALPGGGVLIDTPGLRSIGLNVASETVDKVFADIDELAAECRFADCAHSAEPGCAVLAAVESGDLQERRLVSWRKLKREALYQQAKVDVRLRAEQHKQARRWGKISREARDRARR